jgi:hypothetical protein
MTFQTPEMFIYNGQAFASNDEPLSDFLEQHGLGKLRLGGGISSACWRGYVGIWHITKEKLFLIELRGAFPAEEIELTAVFPECEIRVFAHWFTGIIQLPFGDENEELSMDMLMVIDPSAYEGYHELKFEKGVLVGAREVFNPALIEDD